MTLLQLPCARKMFAQNDKILKETLQSGFKIIYRTELLVYNGDRYWNSESISEAFNCMMMEVGSIAIWSEVRKRICKRLCLPVWICL